jgi:hypothetical protein
MTAKMIGNRGSYNRGGADGIGIRNLNDGLIGWVGVVGKAGDVMYLSAADCTSTNKVDQGYYFQAIGGTVTVDHTLQNCGMSTSKDPAVQAGVDWCNPLDVVPGTILQSVLGFSAIRITFAADGEFYVVAR